MPLSQNPSAVFMVRPTGFATNPETAADNHFQVQGDPGDLAKALAEFDNMVDALTHAGIAVSVADQHRADIPDAVFPNNWFSAHHDGTLVLYPMFAPSRRLERRADLADLIGNHFQARQVIDLSKLEEQDRFLEGTGAIVFDHTAQTAFMARSNRADEDVLAALCEALGYTPLPFDATDADGRPIYHTNVMMAIGQHTALFGDDTVVDEVMRRKIDEMLCAHGRTLVRLSHSQIASFAGNALEVDGAHGPVLVLSETAFRRLSAEHCRVLGARVAILPVPIPTIEKSGGSARCMMAGLHRPAV